jgi:hypothetical protein
MNKKIDNNNIFQHAINNESFDAKEKRFNSITDDSENVAKTKEKLKRELYKQIKEKQQPLYLTLQYDDMLNDICRDKSTTKTIQLRKYVEDAILRDHKKIDT